MTSKTKMGGGWADVEGGKREKKEKKKEKEKGFLFEDSILTGGSSHDRHKGILIADTCKGENKIAKSLSL